VGADSDVLRDGGLATGGRSFGWGLGLLTCRRGVDEATAARVRNLPGLYAIRLRARSEGTSRREEETVHPQARKVGSPQREEGPPPLRRGEYAG
jgi:hypothetical protein